jgi:hypothetical protein
MNIPWNRPARSQVPGVNRAVVFVLAAVVGGLSGAGCVENLPAQDQPCPCSAGYTCDTSAGEPGFCRQGDPKDECLQPRVIDRFDDGLLSDWTESSKEISIVDGRLLAQRTGSTALGNAVRKIELAPGRFALEVAVELKTNESWARASIGTATGDVIYTMLLSNNTQDTNRTGFYLLGGTYYGVNSQTNPKELLVEKEFMPEQGRVYYLRLSVDPEGKAELFLDGERVGTAQVDKPTASMTKVQLGGGQNSNGGHGGYFDNLVVRGCPLPKPTMEPDATHNPVSDVQLWYVHHDGQRYLGYQLVKGNKTPDDKYAPDTIDVHSSVDGVKWTLLAKDALDGTHTDQRKYITNIAVAPTPDGKLRAYISAGSNGCHELNKVYLAESADALTWDAKGVAMPHGATGTFDSYGLYVSDVVRVDDTYHLYYEALWTNETGAVCPLTDDNHRRMGQARLNSKDGVTWERQGIVLEQGLQGDGDSDRTQFAHVWREGDRWRMLYCGATGGSYNLHYATSSDGISWTKLGRIHQDIWPLVGVVPRNGKIEVFYVCDTGTCRGVLKEPGS